MTLNCSAPQNILSPKSSTMDTHPQVYKDNKNGTTLSQALGDAPLCEQETTLTHDDCYPAAIRAIENSNSDELREQLHQLESKH